MNSLYFVLICVIRISTLHLAFATCTPSRARCGPRVDVVPPHAVSSSSSSCGVVVSGAPTGSWDTPPTCQQGLGARVHSVASCHPTIELYKSIATLILNQPHQCLQQDISTCVAQVLAVTSAAGSTWHSNGGLPEACATPTGLVLSVTLHMYDQSACRCSTWQSAEHSVHQCTHYLLHTGFATPPLGLAARR